MREFGYYGLTALERIGVALARHTIAGRGRARQVVERVFLSQRETPRDGLIWGGKAKLRLPANSSLKYLIADRRYNNAERACLSRVIREGDVIADIGANIGFYTLWLAALKVPRTTIVAVEPNPPVYEALVENIRLNGFDDVVAINAAVGEKDGTVSFGVRDDEPSVGSILATGGKQITVAMRTLAGILEEHGLSAIDVVKIDVEGYEYQALMPYLEAIPVSKWPRLFVIEHKHQARQSGDNPVDVIMRNGYRMVMKARGNAVLEKIAESASAA